MPYPAAWHPKAHGVMPQLEPKPSPGAEFPFGCRWCARTLSYDTVEHCEELGGTVHAECHSLRCMNPACAYLTCTPERCDTLTECGNCGEPLCDQHRGDQVYINEDGEQFHDYECV